MADAALLAVADKVDRTLARMTREEFSVPTGSCGIHVWRQSQSETPKSIDILVLSKFPPNTAKLIRLKHNARESGCSLAVWALICARGPFESTTRATDLRIVTEEYEGREGHKDKVLVQRERQLPWTDWLREAIRAVSPKVVLVCVYTDKDTTFSDIWSRMPVKYSDCIVATDVDDGWFAAETKLRQNHLFGRKRLADDSLDAVAIITGADAGATAAVRRVRDADDEDDDDDTEPAIEWDGGNLVYGNTADEKAPEITASKAVQAKAVRLAAGSTGQRARVDMHPPPAKTMRLDTFFKSAKSKE